METSPLYQSMLDSGMNAVNRTAAAKGELGSGNRLADLMKVGQDSAAKYYFPQQQALAGLSGIQGDSGQRAIGARTLLEGSAANQEMKMSRLKDLLGGFGAKTPTQQLLESMYGGGTGGGGGSLLGQAAGAVKNWFGGSSDWAPGDYQGFNNSIDPGMANWDNQVSSWGGGSDWWNNGGSSLTAPTDYSSGINLSGPSQDYSSWDNLLKGGNNSMWGAY